MRNLFFVFCFVLFIAGCDYGFELKKPLEEFVESVNKKEIQKVEEYSETVFDKEGEVNEKFLKENCDWQMLERVVDGDTLLLVNGNRVRVLGIDTPESKHPRKPKEFFSMEATKKMKSYFEISKKVCLLGDPKADKIDRYKRLLAHVFSEELKDIGLEMIEEGFARGYFRFPFSRKFLYKKAQKEAQKNLHGLWERTRIIP